jgi:hypothetical protein
MEWTPLNTPRPEDGKPYDIRLKDGSVVTDVTYWDYGCGFEPLELEESPSTPGSPVKYPLSQVAAFRPAATIRQA